MGFVFGADRGEVKGKSALARLTTRLASSLSGSVVDTLYPPVCLTCDATVLEPGTLCAACWQDTAFVTGLVCEHCGAEQAGHPSDGPVFCDDCLAQPRPWNRGRAVMAYGGMGRRLILGLKYGDRHDAVAPAAGWLHRVTAPLIRPDTIIAPVPLHRWRLFQRRYNQSALLGMALGRRVARPCLPDMLVRLRATGTQDGKSRDGRFANVAGAFAVNPRRVAGVAGRHILLIDDVMTSGATLSAATEACYLAGADAVDVAVLARVGRQDR
jgi:ComF family protein